MLSHEKSHKNGKELMRLVFAATTLIQMPLLINTDDHSNPGPSNWTDILICHANIRSIRRFDEKLDHFKCHLFDSYDIVILSETWINNDNRLAKETRWLEKVKLSSYAWLQGSLSCGGSCVF